MVFVVVNSRTLKRVRKNGRLTPVFNTAHECITFIEDDLNNSRYVTCKRVGKK